MKHPLADNYRAEREALLALGHTISDEQAAVKTTACPAWSIKDVYAHLAGIASDILSGNTEGAATEAWADAQVSGRTDRSLAEVLSEWETAGAEVSAIADASGEVFPLQLFVDQWTHGWDIRASLGDSAAATPDLAVYEHFLPDLFENMRGRIPADLPELTLRVGGETITMGTAPAVGELELDLFEYARISMGRRSRRQLDALPWPAGLDDPSPYIDLLVFWSVNDQDVTDPVLAPA